MTREPYRPMLLSLAALAALPAVRSQQKLWEIVGIQDRSQLGFPRFLGDVSGDRWPDFVAGIRMAEPGKGIWDTVGAFSGRTGRMLYQAAIPGPAFSATSFSAVGDLNQDGARDFCMGAIPSSSGFRFVIAYSGRDGTELWRSRMDSRTSFGSGVAGNLDTNGDGYSDVLATAPALGLYGTVFVLDGRNGQVLRRVQGTASVPFGNVFGPSIDAVGDVDGDGGDDWVAGGADLRQPPGYGAGVVVSGKTGKVLVIGSEKPHNHILGESVAGIGDMDLDGIPDFAAASTARSSQITGAIYAFSGRTGAVIQRWTSDRFSHLFQTRLFRGRVDVDRDGVVDIVQSGVGAFRALSGRDGSVILEQRGSVQQAFAAVADVAMAPDQPFPLIVETTARFGYSRYLSSRGRITCYRMSPPGTETWAKPCGATAADRPEIGCRRANGTATRQGIRPRDGLRVSVYGARPGSAAALALGLSDRIYNGQLLPISLRDLGLSNCYLRVANDLTLIARTGTTGIDAGYARFDLPVHPTATGRHQLFAQWLTLSPQGLTGTSDALSLRVDY